MQNDVTYLAILLALFALMFALVKACDLIIGPDEAALDELGADPGPQGIAVPMTATEDDGQVAA